MKKTDLIELLKDIADDGDINDTILKTDEFKGLKDLSKLSADNISEIFNSEVGKAYMTSHDDSVRSKAVETFKNGKMQEEIRKAVEEAKNEKKSPEQLEIEKLKKQFENKNTKQNQVVAHSKNQKKEELPDWFNKELKNEEMSEDDMKELDDILNSIDQKISSI